jgi:hypothetical protein
MGSTFEEQVEHYDREYIEETTPTNVSEFYPAIHAEA